MKDRDLPADDIAFLERLMRYQDGALDADEIAVLEREMMASPEKRRLFAEVQLHSMSIHERLRQEAYRPASRPKRVVWIPWLQWRPLAAAAAGLVLGLCSASVVWGYVSPVKAMPKPMMVPIVKGSFEGPDVAIADAFPSRPGQWGGDACRVTSVDGGITPVHGRQMLRLIGTSGRNTRGKPTLSGDYYQIVDLRPFRAQFADGCADLRISAWFNAVKDTGDQDYTARVEIQAFHGDPASLHPEGDARSWLGREQIATAGRRILFDHDPATWQHAATRIELPVETDYVVVGIHVVPARPVQSSVPDAFPGHYVDFIRLALLPRARSSKPLPFDSGS